MICCLALKDLHVLVNTAIQSTIPSAFVVDVIVVGLIHSVRARFARALCHDALIKVGTQLAIRLHFAPPVPVVHCVLVKVLIAIVLACNAITWLCWLSKVTV